MSRALLALVMLASLASFSFAGEVRGLHGRVEGPARESATYTLRVHATRSDTRLEPWGMAEGVVEGKHRTVLLRLEPTDRRGVYRFQRAWPQEGRWMLRIFLGNAAAPLTIATLRDDGTVGETRYLTGTDGIQECLRALGVPVPEDC
ncbi:MAG: hypothetical protein RL487_695 [Actinomycetota bacterium]|jgi:hypothetical protein